MTESNDRAKRRPKRVPLGVKNVLTAPKRPGYVRRFVNDNPGRIKQFEDAGYTVVCEDVPVGDPVAGKTMRPGSAVTVPTGVNTDSVLMEIKKEWYDADQRKKQEEIDRSEAAMQNQATFRRNGLVGDVTVS